MERIYIQAILVAFAGLFFVLRRVIRGSSDPEHSWQPTETTKMDYPLPQRQYAPSRETTAEDGANHPTHVYLLSTHPSSYYLEQFDETAIKFVPHRAAGHYVFRNGEHIKVDRTERSAIYQAESSEHGVISINTDYYKFDVIIPSNGFKIDPELIAITKQILGNIVEMDTGPLSTPSSSDHNGYLQDVKVDYQKIEFHYVSATINADWERFFFRDSKGNWKEEWSA